jgi:hypothetical protein
MKEAPGCGHAVQDRRLAAAARLSKHRPGPRIAAETIDVVADPFKGEDDVLHAHVG